MNKFIVLEKYSRSTQMTTTAEKSASVDKYTNVYEATQYDAGRSCAYNKMMNVAHPTFIQFLYLYYSMKNFVTVKIL